MEKYKCLRDFDANALSLPVELMKEIVWTLYLMETQLTRDDTACVLLLDFDDAIELVYDAYPYLKDADAEMDEVYSCENNELFQIMVYVIYSADSNICVIKRLRTREDRI